MMIIEGPSGKKGSWHVGEDMRIPEGYVLTFQVDGHELTWFLGAMAKILGEDGLRLEYPVERLTPIL
jgi:hypothetical protein